MTILIYSLENSRSHNLLVLIIVNQDLFFEICEIRLVKVFCLILDLFNWIEKKCINKSLDKPDGEILEGDCGLSVFLKVGGRLTHATFFRSKCKRLFDVDSDS